MASVLPMSSDATHVEKRPNKSRRYQLTLNEPSNYKIVLDYLTKKKSFKYLISCKEEAPTTKHEHIHIYVCYSNSVRLSLDKVCRAHVESCRGNHQQNKDYILKGGKPLDEIGTEPHQGMSHTVSELLEVEDPTELPGRLFKTWKDVKSWNQSQKKKRIYCPNKEVYFLWGDSGAGKTKWVFEHIGEEEPFDRVRFQQGFWQGLSIDRSVRIAWYDDFRDSHMHPSELISFCDYYQNNMNYKGGSMLSHYDKIFITSVQNPANIYPNMRDEEPKQQWLRRIKVIHFDKDGSVTEEEK